MWLLSYSWNCCQFIESVSLYSSYKQMSLLNSFLYGLTLYWFLGNCQKFDGRSWRKVKPDEVQIITKIEGQVCNGSLFYLVCIILSQFYLTYISSLIGCIEFFVYFNFRCGWHFISSCYIQKRGGSTNLQTTERRRY